MVQDYSEKQTRRFEVDIVGTITGDELVLVEDFVLTMVKPTSVFGLFLVQRMAGIQAKQMTLLVSQTEKSRVTLCNGNMTLS